MAFRSPSEQTILVDRIPEAQTREAGTFVTVLRPQNLSFIGLLYGANFKQL